MQGVHLTLVSAIGLIAVTYILISHYQGVATIARGTTTAYADFAKTAAGK